MLNAVQLPKQTTGRSTITEAKYWTLYNYRSKLNAVNYWTLYSYVNKLLNAVQLPKKLQSAVQLPKQTTERCTIT